MIHKRGESEKGENHMKSMEVIYREHAKTVYGFLLSKTKNAELAEELTQETFYQALKGIDCFEGKSSVTTWLCSIAKNQWSNYLKKHKTQELIGDEIETLATQSTEEHVIERMNRVELMKLLHQLDEPMREVMYLRISGDLSFREIGEVLGRTENWARVTFYRGKERVLKEVKKYES